MRSIKPFDTPQEVICFTALNSPSETRAEAISIRSMFNSCSNNLANVSFYDAVNDTPEVCSPSRRVVSIISIVLLILSLVFLIRGVYFQ